MKRIITLLLIVLLTQFSCKKADKYAQLVNDQPYLITGEVALYSLGMGQYPGYPKSFLVGDTATFVGRLFVDRPDFKIQVGNDTAHIIFHARVPSIPDTLNPYTHNPNELDVVRFLITGNMGVGNSVPVSITANGVTIQAPVLSIQKFQGIKRQTDTTLYVDGIATWQLPAADLPFYAQYGLPTINNMNIAGNGTICLGNWTGVYTLEDQQVSQVLHTGDQLQENGEPFGITMILGSVLSFGGDTLIFSAQVAEHTPDTATNYIFRICKMDLATKRITTINRTKVVKGIPTANGNPGPYEGPIGSVPVVAANLKTDANGSLYFLNDYAPANTSNDNTGNWYKYPFGGGLSQGNLFFGNNAYVLSNICRADTKGNVKSLFSNHNPFFPLLYTAVPGYASAQTSDYLVSLDGQTGYACDQAGFSGTSLGYFNLQTDALLISTGYYPPGFRFFSYDTSSVTRYGYSLYGFMPTFNNSNYNYLNNYLILPDGDLLNVAGYSLAAVNLENKTAYCYAGTEVGLLYNAPPSQNQSTGPAKYVNFLPATFIGTDKLGSVYYYTANMGSNVSFYKLYSRK